MSIITDNVGHPRGHPDQGDGGALPPVLCQHLLARLLRLLVRLSVARGLEDPGPRMVCLVEQETARTKLQVIIIIILLFIILIT